MCRSDMAITCITSSGSGDLSVCASVCLRADAVFMLLLACVLAWLLSASQHKA